MLKPFALPWVVVGPTRRFHVALEARRRFGVDDELVTIRGDLMLADPDVAARLAAAVERQRDPSEPPLTGADLYAGALLEEVYHLLIAHHLRDVDPTAFRAVADRLEPELGEQARSTLLAFVMRYPPADISAGRRPPAAQLDDVVEGVPGREVVLEELLTCWLANANPALSGARPLVDDRPLRSASAYEAVIALLRGTLAQRPGPFGGGASLFDELLAPLRASPLDLRGQLRFVRERWSGLLGARFEALLGDVLAAIDALEEVHRLRGGPPGGPDPGHTRAMLAAAEAEAERFSPDASWMPRVVLVAKNSYVWLDQLSREYGREIARLDQIPDEALAGLARRGITALWLIGLWERSHASRRVKQLRGQPDAVASAYALFDYVIAEDLGGEAAYEALREAAARHGLRLASDMVPNHVGIDGRWVIEHPEWFVQLDHPPFPGYTFDGPELSRDPRLSVSIEDRYYDGSDAAVVFRRRDTASGETRFIYHGNDGTAMPWNDTAQLDYLKAEVREAVIRTILAVARRFPIIRFDAAMTLARRHVRRLWYPEPGRGGAIPSRGRYGAMSDEEFDAAMPHEFWREVVDRAAVEAPDTLLLAEAFWMMEGYFVRTLGMHRVYNSAFMHMTKNEDGHGYRGLMKETLAFDPQVLKRFVNFMNNPDEESARVQFGDGDKYFAAATLLATMPGLPMIGHGQFEGYREKYGMEFRRARLGEQTDRALLERHDRELVPLLHRRAQFAEVDHFRLFDVVDADGAVLEDVYAYSNRAAGAASLVLVNLRYPRSVGFVRTSAPFAPAAGAELRREGLAEALGVGTGGDRFVVMHEHLSSLTYLHRAERLHADGLWVQLDGYGRQVFLDVHERVDHDGRLARLFERLQGAGTPALDEALEELRLEGVHAAFRSLLEADGSDGEALRQGWIRFVSAGPVTAGAELEPLPQGTLARVEAAVGPFAARLAWAVHLVSHAAWPLETYRVLRLGRLIADALPAREGVTPAAAAAMGAVALAAHLEVGESWRRDGVAPSPLAWLQASLRAPGAVEALGVNAFEGVRWFGREAALELADVSQALLRLQRPGRGPATAAASWRRRTERLLEASGYRVDAVLEPSRAVRAAAAARPPSAPKKSAEKKSAEKKSATKKSAMKKSATKESSETKPAAGKRGRPSAARDEPGSPERSADESGSEPPQGEASVTPRPRRGRRGGGRSSG